MPLFTLFKESNPFENSAYPDWRKNIENAFLNYLNKTEEHEFFVLKKNIDDIDMTQNILFFYPTDNDQYQPMPNELITVLKDNGFELYKDSYGILIYKK